jgi:hypothetical protein
MRHSGVQVSLNEWWCGAWAGGDGQNQRDICSRSQGLPRRCSVVVGTARQRMRRTWKKPPGATVWAAECEWYVGVRAGAGSGGRTIERECRMQNAECRTRQPCGEDLGYRENAPTPPARSRLRGTCQDCTMSSPRLRRFRLGPTLLPDCRRTNRVRAVAFFFSS